MRASKRHARHHAVIDRERLFDIVPQIRERRVNQTYAFRTPSLRNLSATAPYMHNGVFATLPDVTEFYQQISRGGGRRGGRGARVLNPQVNRDQIDPLARRLNMRGRGQRDLIAFLRALDDPGFDRTVPNHVPSGLPVGGRIQP